MSKDFLLWHAKVSEHKITGTHPLPFPWLILGGLPIDLYHARLAYFRFHHKKFLLKNTLDISSLDLAVSEKYKLISF